MSLRDGRVKMSKSDPSDQSRINLTDDTDAIALKIRRAKTDPDPLPESTEGLEERPEADNLVASSPPSPASRRLRCCRPSAARASARTSSRR